MENLEQFETVRHGDKNKDGGLSDLGIEQAQEKASEIAKQIESAPGGSVFFVIPSAVGRATTTGQTIELELNSLLEGNHDVVFISFNDKEALQNAKTDFTKKFVVTGIKSSEVIGFNAETKYVPAWKEYGKNFNGDEYSIMEAWVSKPEEIGTVRSDMKERFPEIDESKINPADFVQTPEEEAIKYVRLMKVINSAVEKYMPGHQFKNIQVGHNTADIATLALMGKEISATNLKELLNGKSRNFLEGSTLEEKEGKIIVKYRKNEVGREISLEDVIKNLEQQSEERKKIWKNNE